MHPPGTVPAVWARLGGAELSEDPGSAVAGSAALLRVGRLAFLENRWFVVCAAPAAGGWYSRGLSRGAPAATFMEPHRGEEGEWW